MKRPLYYSRKADSAYALGFTLLAVSIPFAAGFAGCAYSGTKLPAVGCAAFAIASFLGALVEFRIARHADARATTEARYQLTEMSTKRHP